MSLPSIRMIGEWFCAFHVLVPNVAELIVVISESS